MMIMTIAIAEDIDASSLQNNNWVKEKGGIKE
jgi:hypothetical protein